MRMLVLATAAFLGATADSSAAESWLIPADKIYTAPDAAPIPNGAVLTSNEKIAAVWESLAIPPRAAPRTPLWFAIRRTVGGEGLPMVCLASGRFCGRRARPQTKERGARRRVSGGSRNELGEVGWPCSRTAF